jgi:hypothetical protein
VSHESFPTADDQVLSAYLDGELSAEETAALEARLRREPPLARRLQTLRGTDEALRSAYGPIAGEPLPESILALLEQSPDTPEHAAAGTVVDLRRRSTRRAFTIPAAIAASIALLAGFLLGTLVTTPPPEPGSPLALVPRDGNVEASTTLHELLHSLPSGASREVMEGHSAMPRLTFLTADGTPCRQLDVASADATTEMLACRRGERWRIELVALGPPPPAPADGIYRPASGPPSEAMDNAVDLLIEGPPLGAEAEHDLIERGWAQPRR